MTADPASTPQTAALWEQPNLQPGALRQSLELEIADLEAKLGPPDRNLVFAELTKCLVLTAPSGMSAEDRRAWLVVAFEEIAGIPACNFAAAVRHARQTADHPAKIVPAICGYKPDYDAASVYRRSLDTARKRLANLDAPRLTADTASKADGERHWTQAEVDEANETFRQIGIATRYRRRDDGTIETTTAGEDQEREAA